MRRLKISLPALILFSLTLWGTGCGAGQSIAPELTGGWVDSNPGFDDISNDGYFIDENGTGYDIDGIIDEDPDFCSYTYDWSTDYDDIEMAFDNLSNGEISGMSLETGETFVGTYTLGTNPCTYTTLTATVEVDNTYTVTWYMIKLDKFP